MSGGVTDILLKTVLIDTWWNVNFVCCVDIPMLKERFNRYMVECEFK